MLIVSGAAVKEVPLFKELPVPVPSATGVKEVPHPSASLFDVRFALWPLGLDKERVGTPGDIDGQIVGGNDAYAGQFPHQVSMQVMMPKSQNNPKGKVNEPAGCQ